MPKFLLKFIKTFFYDNNGTLVIWQWPNIPLLTWFMLLVASWISDAPTSHTLSGFSSGALLVWGLLELVHGVSLFRRVLGITVVIVVLMSM